MLNERELSAAIGSTAYDPEGDSIGTVEHFFVDDRTGAPTWVAVTTGLFGTRHSIVPALDATFTDGALRLPVSREAVRSAPQIGQTQHLDPGEETQLRRHYGLQPGSAEPGSAEPGSAAPSDGAMTRSEERLRVSTEQVAATRLRLVKYVVTEEVQVTVPVRREEIRLEEVPLDAPDPGPGESLVPEDRRADAGAPVASGTTDRATDVASTGLPEEIVLHREEPVVSVRIVPVERVRLRTEVVQGQERVGAQLQRERITVDEEPVAPRSGG